MPVELEKKQKEKLLKWVLLNGLGCLFFAGIIFGYVLPTYDSISQKKTATKDAQEVFLKLQKDGVTPAEYSRILQAYVGIKSKWAPSKGEIAEIATALKKTGKQENYLDWANEELGRKSEFDIEINKNNRIVSDIMPTYSDIVTGDSLFQQNRITLTDLVRFVEEDLLIANNLESNSPIGFGAIVFSSKDNPVSNIGTYSVNLDITGRNKNLKALVESVQKSGSLIIKDGKIQSPSIDSITQNSASKKFSNLLINIKSATFPMEFDANPEKESSMTLNMQMYVRAQNLSDLLSLKDQLVQKAETLKKEVDLYASKCDTPNAPFCTKDSYYRAVQTIKANINEVSEVTKKISSTKKASANANVDLQTEFDTVIKLYRDFSSAEGLVSRAINTIESTLKSDTQAKN